MRSQQAPTPSPIVPHDTTLAPPPPGVRHVPVPWVGIVIADDDVRDRVDRVFHWPMILLALAVLPLLVIEFFQRPDGWLALVVRIGFAIIWLAFVVEFIIKVAIAESRLEYARRNWLDVIIIIVPVFRPLRLARTARVFKLRGVGTKGGRYILSMLLGMDATERLLQRIGIKAPVARPDPNEMTRYALTKELRALRTEVDAWHDWYRQMETQGLIDSAAPDAGEESDEPPDRT